MLAKWITCDVPAETRDAFAAAQARWTVIADQPGLVGQVGGWDRRSGRAHVLALWADADSHRLFLRDRHDAVADASGYHGIEVALGETVLTLPGTAATVAEAMQGQVLRVADCRLAEGAHEHFEDVQRHVWAPAMAAAGVLGGVVARLAPDRVLVATFWPDEDTHRRYAGEVPRLRARADVDADVTGMTGHVLPLEPAWRVRAVR
ncbi:hypothetical protein ADK67_00030 [Saccharothrix sp. NRRL B-16348]|uniref:DUF4937 domain-containing protein n=1 Tax=Saccharothrix sp. NRRL B-16348 TaxID=1415542 RepID=UPI0006AF0219|nr:DUF4937 domain-containing protein [Saccharothrix sp. NRRL B-16348]KOX34998.1 hypothetical protein ADK67_00030 [Saccharothrix sp. NRRL B-16348]